MYHRTKMDEQFTDWHSVRPWQPTLSLSVREITSVSVTFILSSPYSVGDPANPEPSLVSLGLSSSDDDDQSRDSASTVDTTQVVSDILTRLTVKVNGTPWQRVLLKVDEVLDEAIIILYGLMPSRQYDVELGILPGEASIRGQITTDAEARTDTALSDPLPDEAAVSSPESSSAPLPSSPPHPCGGNHSPNGHTPPNVTTLEDRRQQVLHTLSLLTTEQSSLTSSLKSARKESQKADAALRSEIDTLKRASDRHAAGESRARKKVLALQEAVKQTLAAAHDFEALVQDIEGALPGLEESKTEVEREWVKAKGEAERAKARRDEAEQKEKARAEAMQAELAILVNRLEKLNSKREKLEGEGGVLADLEEKLRKLEEERERVEKDPYGFDGDVAADSEDSGPRTTGERTKEDSSPDSDKPHHASSHHNNNAPPPHATFQPSQHHPRKRHSHPVPHQAHQQHHHPRSSFPPRSAVHQDAIHRPPVARSSFPTPAHPMPGVIHLQHQHGPHPHKNAHANHIRPPFRQQSSGSGSGSSSSGAPTPVAVNASSTLSGRAPPFEPGRGRAYSHSHPQGPAQASVAAKSDLNPGSTPFAPRPAVVQAVASAVGSNVIGSGRAG